MSSTTKRTGRGTRKPPASPASTVRIALAPDVLEHRRRELGDVRRSIAAEEDRIKHGLAEIAARRKALADLRARAEKLVDCLVTGEEDQPAQLELPPTPPASVECTRCHATGPATDVVPAAQTPAKKMARTPELPEAPAGPLTISLREADLNELIRDRAVADVLCWTAAETEIAWSPDGPDEDGRHVVESDPLDDADLARVRAALGAAGVHWCESIPAGDVVREVPARGWVTPPPDEDERPAPADPDELVRQSGQKHVIVERAFGSWRRAHHGLVKSDALQAWRRVKAAARRLGREASWYEHGVVIQRFDPADLRNRKPARAEASP